MKTRFALHIKTGMLIAGGLLFATTAFSQSPGNRYPLADQLYRQQQFEEAYPIFRELHKENPGTFLFLDRAAGCLIKLKRYDEAVELVRNATHSRQLSLPATILLGDILHIRGDTEEAFTVWDRVLEEHGENQQTYITLARTMRERQEFDRAIALFEKVREKFSDTILLKNELANTYMQAGYYEKAMQEYLSMVREDPNRVDYIQQILFRYNDEYLYDAAILGIEDFLNGLSRSHPSYQNLHQLEIWLLVERQLYARALHRARQFESSTLRITYSLYSLGSRLAGAEQFELAVEAYSYYIENNIYPGKSQAMEQLAGVYRQWARYLSEHGLSFEGKSDSLYANAIQTLDRLIKDDPSYDTGGRITLQKAELILDHQKDPETAESLLQSVGAANDEDMQTQKAYLEGRILLYRNDYNRARIAFARSNRLAQAGEMKEKTRYFSALTDFYAGEYEFAGIQLQALERQSTSYYANNAVQLRSWIRKGLAVDSTGSDIEPFARALHHFERGDLMNGLRQLKPIIAGNAFHPLKEDALVLISRNLTPQTARITYYLIHRFLNSTGRYSSVRERLLWEKARIADQFFTSGIIPESRISSEELFFAGEERKLTVSIPVTREDIQQLYEALLLEFPDGFYASFARERIRELQNSQT